MLPKFQFLVKLEHHDPEPITVTANDAQVAAHTAVLSAQWKLGQKLNLIGSDGDPSAAGNQLEELQLLGFGA
ncbi:hypothetical protein N9Y00_07065 [Tateyamaria sp.]|jgi:hypothetical protein|nr:hypothetical protein [Tateyamaria sp.]